MVVEHRQGRQHPSRRTDANVQDRLGPYRAAAHCPAQAIVDRQLAARGAAVPGGVIVRVALHAGLTSLPDPAVPEDVHPFTATVQLTTRWLGYDNHDRRGWRYRPLAGGDDISRCQDQGSDNRRRKVDQRDEERLGCRLVRSVSHSNYYQEGGPTFAGAARSPCTPGPDTVHSAGRYKVGAGIEATNSQTGVSADGSA